MARNFISKTWHFTENQLFFFLSVNMEYHIGQLCMQYIVGTCIKNSPASSSLKDSIAWFGLFLKVSSANESCIYLTKNTQLFRYYYNFK